MKVTNKFYQIKTKQYKQKFIVPPIATGSLLVTEAVFTLRKTRRSGNNFTSWTASQVSKNKYGD
jgi:hypothetical protein